jgi:hypothetical protein
VNTVMNLRVPYEGFLDCVIMSWPKHLYPKINPNLTDRIVVKEPVARMGHFLVACS